MWQFLKYTLATLLGLALFFTLIFAVFLGIGAAASSQTVEVEDGSVLRIKLNQPINERAPESPFGEFAFAPKQLGLIDILKALKNAREDDRIRGIYLESSFVQAGSATLEEIRDELVAFRESGKFIVAYGELYTEKSYYLASVADAIYLNPVGGLEFNGFYQEVTFLKNTLERLGVQPEIFRVGDYKSAVEPFIRTDLSEENRTQITSYLNSLHGVFLNRVSESRNISVPTLQQLADSLAIREPEDALTHGLVTHVGYEDEALALLREKLGQKDENEKIEFISLSKYSQAESVIKVVTTANKVALVVADGVINSGKGSAQEIGSESYVKTLRKLRRDDNVKAVVLRINSPGGSATASDVLWREIQLLKEKKPVIASMSDAAASGGYYMAMGCDTILAQPNTITGSIGVFLLLFNAEQFLSDKLGVVTERVETSPHAAFALPTNPISEFERRVIQDGVDEAYQTFVAKAAEGRGMTEAQLRSVASGRVWTGEQALENGLVDALGGLDEAIEMAAAAAGLEADDYRVREYPQQKDFFERLQEDFEAEVQARVAQHYFGDYYPYVKAVEAVKTMEGIQARLPFDILPR